MPRWSRRQDEYLLEHCNEGPERIAAAMRNRFGISRTPEAVRRHAYRIGVPIVEYEICPECGRKVDHIGHHGMCYACSREKLAAEQRARNDALRAEIKRNNSAEERRKAERAYDAARAEATRLRRKLRGCGRLYGV